MLSIKPPKFLVDGPADDQANTLRPVSILFKIRIPASCFVGIGGSRSRPPHYNNQTLQNATYAQAVTDEVYFRLDVSQGLITEPQGIGFLKHSTQSPEGQAFCSAFAVRLGKFRGRQTLADAYH